MPELPSSTGLNQTGGSGIGADSIILNAVSSPLPVMVMNSSPIPVKIVSESVGLGKQEQPQNTWTDKSNLTGMDRLIQGFGKAQQQNRMRADALRGGGSAGKGMDWSGMKAGLGTAAMAILGPLKSNFVDPMIGLAKSGFGAGVSRGMGGQTLFKVFEVVGVTLGAKFLPIIIKASSWMLSLTEGMKDGSTVIGKFFDDLAILGDKVFRAFQWLDNWGKKEGEQGNFSDIYDRETTSLLGTGIPKSMLPPGMGDLLQSLEGLMTGKGGGIGAGGKNSGIPASQTPIGDWLPKEWQKGMKKLPGGSGTKADPLTTAMQDIITSMKQNIGGQGAISDVGNLRQQAQMAAMQDPLEARMKTTMLEAIDAFLAGMPQLIQNTDPNGK